MKRRNGFFLHKIGKKYDVKHFDTLVKIAEYLELTYNKIISAYQHKYLLLQQYAINTKLTINWRQYHIPKTYKKRHRINVSATKINGLFELQNTLHQIEHKIPFFDSFTGLNKRKIDAYKPTYKLTELEAKQQDLQPVFEGSVYFFDRTKHLYIKQDETYYYIPMFFGLK